MKKLIQGIVEFRNNVKQSYHEMFAKLALGQKPDTLFIACSDSRVVPNLFASTNPGDLFVIRNVGNLVPECDNNDVLRGDTSAAAALEFSLGTLDVFNIVVCGHSECGAMQTLIAGRSTVPYPHLKQWLKHGEQSLTDLDQQPEFAKNLEYHNRLSQMNVLTQMKHLKTFPVVKERLTQGTLSLHGWWFDLKQAEVFAYEEGINSFVLIDEEEANRIFERLKA